MAFQNHPGEITKYEKMALDFFIERGLFTSFNNLIEVAHKEFPSLDREEAIISYFDEKREEMARSFKSKVTKEKLKSVLSHQ